MTLARSMREEMRAAQISDGLGHGEKDEEDIAQLERSQD